MSNRNEMIEEKLKVLGDQIDILNGLLDASIGEDSTDKEKSGPRNRPIAALIEELPGDLGSLQDILFKTCNRFESLFVSDGSVEPGKMIEVTNLKSSTGM